MSAKVMGQVWDLVLTPAKQVVLLALADHADHAGHNVKPGIPLIAWKTGYSERQVRRIMNDLEADGLLVRVKERSGKPTIYQIDIGRGTLKPPYVPRKEYVTPDKMSAHDPGQNVRPDKMSALTSHGEDEMDTPDIASAKTARVRHKEEPSLKEKKKDMPPLAAASEPQSNLGLRPIDLSRKTEKGEPDNPSSKGKPKLQPELARNLAGIFGNTSIAKAKLPMIKSECDLYDSDPDFKAFINQLLSKYVRKKDGVIVYDKTMDEFIGLIQEKPGWTAYASSHKPPTDESMTSEGVSSLFGEGFFGDNS